MQASARSGGQAHPNIDERESQADQEVEDFRTGRAAVNTDEGEGHPREISFAIAVGGLGFEAQTLAKGSVAVLIHFRLRLAEFVGRQPPRGAESVVNMERLARLSGGSVWLGQSLKFGKYLRETLGEIPNNARVFQQSGEVPGRHHEIEVIRSVALLDQPIFLVQIG